MNLIQMVQDESYSVYEASKILGINNATAKVIIRNYRRKGRVFIRKNEKKTLKS
jgi:hypothetical protein